MINPRLTLPDLVYVAGPTDTPERRDFNQRIANLARSYNFPIFLPQEVEDELSEDDFKNECREALNHSNLMLAVLYGEHFDPGTAEKVAYTLGRNHIFMSIQNLLLPPTLAEPTPELREQAVRNIPITPEYELCADRLIPLMNRYFLPPSLLS